MNHDNGHIYKTLFDVTSNHGAKMIKTNRPKDEIKNNNSKNKSNDNYSNNSKNNDDDKIKSSSKKQTHYKKLNECSYTKLD